MSDLPNEQCLVPLDANKASDLGTDVVVLRVGHDRQEFIVHKKLFASQGKVVNLIVSKKTVTEAGQDVITFERDDPDVFRLLVGWLYRGHIPRAEPYIDKPDYAESVNRSTPGPSLPDLSSTADEDVAMASGDRGTDQDTRNDEKCAQPACTQKEFREGFPSGLPLRDKKTTRGCKSDPLTREVRVCSESEQPKKRPRLSQDDCDQETPTATGVNGKGETSSVAANDEISKNEDAMNSGDESSHHPKSPPSRMAEASRSLPHELAIDTAPMLFASDLTPPNSTSPADCSTKNKKETTRETLAELPMDLTTWERATEPETPGLVSGSSATPSLPSTPRFDYPRTKTLLEQAIEEADQHQMALVQLIAVAERLY